MRAPRRRFERLAAIALAALTCAVAASATQAAPALVVSDDLAKLIRVDPLSGKRTLASGPAGAGEPEYDIPSGVTVAPDGAIVLADPQTFGQLDGRVLVVDPVSGRRPVVSENGSPSGGPQFVHPSGIAIEPAGTILVTDPGSNPAQLVRVNPFTGARSLVTATGSPSGGPPLSGPLGIDVAPDGTIYVAQSQGATGFGGNGDVLRINPANGARALVADLPSPTDVAVAPDGNLLVTDAGSGFSGPGSLLRINPANGALTTVSSNTSPGGGPELSDPHALALDGAAGAYVVDLTAFGGAPGVIRIDASSGARSTVSSNSAPPSRSDREFFFSTGIAFEPNAPANGGPLCEAARAAQAKARKAVKKAKAAVKKANTKKAQKKAKAALKKAKAKQQSAGAAVEAEC